ncbi:MAG: hypothetical protein B6I36_07800 [Desulfobacteraceae bacterium 4572_35.1]|nr:MAG: hypothetical protein B6I36_07800 [Desulfobacteraceae bacterium 4572_35.1]
MFIVVNRAKTAVSGLKPELKERGCHVINIDWTILVQFANFVVLMVVLNYLLYRPLRGIIDDRRAKIAAGYQKAQGMEDAIAKKMADYESKLQQAKLEGSEEAALMRNEALAQEADIIGVARKDADHELAELKNSIASEADKARVKLKKETKGLAAAIASKVLGRKVK